MFHFFLSFSIHLVHNCNILILILLVVYPGHIEIIADNPASSNKFTVYNCGGKFSIKSEGTSALPETSQASRTKNQAKIILRVTK